MNKQYIFYKGNRTNSIFCPDWVDYVKTFMPKGWYKVFGKDFIKEVNQVLKHYTKEDLKDFYFFDIKEKYGNLRIYASVETPEMSKIFKKYEDMSTKYCIDCGNKSKYWTKGWIMPVCENCARNYNVEEMK